jgi:hypothetical protein
LFFRTSDAPLAESIEAFAGMGLVPCMAAGCDCVVDRPISARWLAGVEGIQNALSSWRPEFRPVSLVGAAPRTPSEPPAPGVGAFFSGGVDSFYTVLRHQDEITHLVTMYGFDIRLDNHAVRRQVSKTLREAAGALGKEFVEIETNFRSFSDRYVSLHQTYGTLLAAIAHVLSPVIGRMYVAASGGTYDVDPWTSRPEVDHLWSTEAVEICLDGCEATRVEKVAAIAQSDTALRSLRVCWKNRKGSYNCGRCEKCLRTMISLYAAGALERCPTFPRALSPRRVYQTEVKGADGRFYARQNLEALEAKGLDPRLCLALRRAVGGKSGGRWRGNGRWLLDSCLWFLGRRP